MPEFRVFVSHSARGEDDTRQLLDELRAGLEAVKDKEGNQKFAVLIDKDDLDPGVLWRQTLNTWIGSCDVAIVLLTEKALNSDYVQYETTVLRYREVSVPEHSCTVIPVLVAPVDAKRVNDTQGFKASQITESQGIVSGRISDPHDRADLIDTVISHLVNLERKESPLQEQEIFLEDLFRRKVPKDKVTNSLKKLEVDLGGWDVDVYRSLALAMLSRGLDGASSRVIFDIRSDIQNRAELEALFEIVATSWIDLRSTRFLGKIATGSPNQRVVALDSTNHFIAEKYVWRASTNPKDPWDVAPVTAAFSEKAVEDLSREIETSLRREVGLEDDGDLQGTLQGQNYAGLPVFVAMPAAGVTTKILDELRLKFPTVTFFLLAGQDERVLQAIEDQKIELLVPPLTKRFNEAHIVTKYKELRSAAVETYLRKNKL
jgi:hypothetical protein